MLSPSEKNTLTTLAGDRRLRYLSVGGINTAVGYMIGLSLYYSLSMRLHIIAISLIINVLSITFSFLTYKLFVFKTSGNWLSEYLRCFVVYGGGAIFGTAGLWVLVDGMGVAFWLAQGGMITGIVVFSYVAHSRFSFAPRKQKNSQSNGA